MTITFNTQPYNARQRRLLTLHGMEVASDCSEHLLLEIIGVIDEKRARQAIEYVSTAPAFKVGVVSGSDGYHLQSFERSTAVINSVLLRDPESVRIKAAAYLNDYPVNQPALFKFTLFTDGDRVRFLMLEAHKVAFVHDDLLAIIEALDTALLLRAAPMVGHMVQQISNVTEIASPQITVTEKHAYWKKQLGGLIAPLKLPLDYERPKYKHYDGRFIQFDLTTEAQKISASSQSSEEVFFYCFALLMHKLCGQQDFLCAWQSDQSPLRSHLPIHFDFANKRSGGVLSQVELFEDVRRELAEACRYSGPLFEELIELAGKPSDPSRSPLADVYFSISGNERYSFGVGGAEGRRIDLAHGKIDFDLGLRVVVNGDRVCAEMGYDSALFAGETIFRYTDYFRNLIQQFLTGSHKPLKDIYLLSSSDRDQIWRESANPIAMPAPQRLHDLFFSAAEKYPDHMAIESPYRSWTYSELASYVNRIARCLGDLGIGAGSFVGVMMEQGWEQTVAVLAINAAGAAYIPINPDLPKSRVGHLLTVCDIQIILSQSYLAQLSEEYPDNTFIFVDKSEHFAVYPDIQMKPQQALNAIAYIIFTSGTTGNPKGVVITHEAVVNTLYDINQRFLITEADKVLALSALNFDLSVYDIFGVLAAGGTVVYPDYKQVRDPGHWLQLVIHHKVSVWNTVPALMGLLCDEAEAMGVDLPSLRIVMMSGDWIPVTLPQRIREVCVPTVSVHSLGGATEASIWSITFPIDRVASSWKRIPYGKALGNQSMLVLDDTLEPCPPGVVGEIHIGGIGLAEGYWKDEEKTRQSFVIHPNRGERLYKTGDLGSYREDGNIEFLGRKDFQVKINGHRIELEDIQSNILKCGKVKEALALVHQYEGTAHLCAYIVPADGERIEDSELIHHLDACLPDYMVPRHYQYLDRLPRSANDKIDRQALTPPDFSQLCATLVPAVTEEQKMLERAWSSVLGVNEIGIRTNYFSIGGDSLRAIRMTSKVKEFGFKMQVEDIYQHQTIEQLAKVIRPLRAQGETNIEFDNTSLIDREDLNAIESIFE